MVSISSLASRAAAAFALVAVLGANQAAAYTAADACTMKVFLRYYDDAVKTTLLSTVEFPIQAGASSSVNDGSSSAINDGVTQAELQLLPGYATISVTGYLCSDSNTEAFVASESSVQTIDGLAAPVAITLYALDQEAVQNKDQSIDFNPIITQVTINPAIGNWDTPSTFTFTAVDPANNQDIGDYQMSGALTTANFDGSQVRGASNAKDSCGAGASCTLVYQPASPEAGNYLWTMTVKDDGASEKQDSVSGYFAVDAAGTLQFGIENWHRPMIDESNLPVVDSDGDSTYEIEYGKSGVITFTVTDPDHANGITGEATTLSVIAHADGAQVTEGSQTNIDCDPSDISIAKVSGPVGEVEVYTATWAPWANGNNNGAITAYGETYCQFTFQVSDAAPVSGGLKSDQVTLTLGAIGTRTTGGVSPGGAIPHFTAIFVSDTTPVNSDVVAITVQFQDEDSLIDFSVTHSGVLSAVTWAEETGTDVEQGMNCQSASGCTRHLLLTIAADADTLSGADKDVHLIVTDASDGNSVDDRTITFSATASARHRRSADGSVALARRNDDNDIGTEPIIIEVVGDKLSLTTSMLGPQKKGRVTDPASPDANDADAAADQIKLSATAVGALVGVGVLAVVLVGVVVRTNQIARRNDASAAKAHTQLEEGVKGDFKQELEYDEYQHGGTLTLAAAAGVEREQGFTTMI